MHKLMLVVEFNYLNVRPYGRQADHV